jgi:hypothetical protein
MKRVGEMVKIGSTAKVTQGHSSNPGNIPGKGTARRALTTPIWVFEDDGKYFIYASLAVLLKLTIP